MVRPLTAVAAALALAVSPGPVLLAQDATAALKREDELRAFAVEALHELADGYAAAKQHGTALALRKEILLEYREDDEKARAACGFTLVGSRWQPDPYKLVLEKNLEAKKSALRKLDRELDRFRRDQIKRHRDVAKSWAKAGETVKSTAHWRRVLALSPDDKSATKELALDEFQGFQGTADELHRLRRGIAIRGAVEYLHRHEFTVERMDGGKHPLLERAGVPHTGYRTENYRIWGALPGTQLQEVAAHCERALALCRTLFGVTTGEPFFPRGYRTLILVTDEKVYHKVLDQCADQFTPERLQFLKEHVDLAFLKHDGGQVRFIKTNGSNDEAFDQSVRSAVQDAVGLVTDGLWEGLGHAACGMLFGKTITFLLEQQDQRTVASWAQQLLVPDIDAWKKIAEQSAWSKSDTRTSELVLISAARFTTEQRVKAWAICDYLFHWRPELLWELDQSQNDVAKTPPQVEAEFQQRTGLELPKIDHDWRQFWARQGDLRAAMKRDPLGPEKDRKRKAREAAREVVDAVNAARIAAARGPVGFYFSEHEDAEGALDWVAAYEKAERDRERKPKDDIPLPDAPASVGDTVLVARDVEPAAAVQQWLAIPAARDALLHAGRGLLGSNRDKNAVVLDLTSPVDHTTRGGPLCWPRAGQGPVPGSARVRDLGPRVAAALAAKGKGPTDVVAMPWTLHFHRELSADQIAAIDVRVYVDGERQDGVLLNCQDEVGRRADGCIAFVGLEPVPGGKDVDIEWDLPAELRIDAAEPFPTIRFSVVE